MREPGSTGNHGALTPKPKYPRTSPLSLFPPGFTTSLESVAVDPNDPHNIYIDVQAEGTAKRMVLNFGGIVAASAHLDFYKAVCRKHGIQSNDCPKMTRALVIKETATRLASRTCKSLEDSLPPAAFAQCLSAAMRSSRAFTSATNEESEFSGYTAYVALPTFTDFEKASYLDLCNSLTQSAISAAGDFGVEGGLWSEDIAERETFVATFAAVDMAAGKNEWRYLEIGFNAGHSAAILLWTFPGVLVDSFDICAHPYTRINFKRLLRTPGPDGIDFKRRLNLTCGDSTSTIPAQAAALEAAKKEGADRAALADAVRIDGGHSFEVASADLAHARRLAKPGALVVVDDCQVAEVWAAWALAVDLGLVVPRRPGLGWKGSCIGNYS